MGKGHSDHSVVCVATETALWAGEHYFQDALTDPDLSDSLVIHNEASTLQLLLVHIHALVCSAIVPGAVAPCSGS